VVAIDLEKGGKGSFRPTTREVAGARDGAAGGDPGLGPQPTARRYSFTTIKPIPLQVDGELLALDPGTPVRVDIARGARHRDVSAVAHPARRSRG
jgi:hypothetical protein